VILTLLLSSTKITHRIESYATRLDMIIGSNRMVKFLKKVLAWGILEDQINMSILEDQSIYPNNETLFYLEDNFGLISY